MRIDNRVSGNTIVVEPRGRLTVETAGEFAHHCARLLERGHTHFVLDLAGVPYIDSIGLGAIVRAHTSARGRGGELRLLNVAGRNRHLLSITGLLTVLDTCELDESEGNYDGGIANC